MIPRLDLFISLIGALASSCLAIIFPAIIETCTFWNYPKSVDEANDGHERHQESKEDECHSDGSAACFACRRRMKRIGFLIKNFLLVILGLLGLVTGGWQSISQLVTFGSE